MKFACLGLMDERVWAGMSKVEQEAYAEECFAYDDLLAAAGHWVDGGEALRPAHEAKVLRVKEGKVVVTDGPFAETKEQLGGLGVLEARDMEHAVELIKKHPCLRHSTFEIRPIDEAMTERCDMSHDPGSCEGGQRFVCIAWGDEANWNAIPADQQEALVEACMEYGNVINNVGQIAGGMAMQSANLAKTLRARDGKVIVTDGPFAETKEQLGGVAIFTMRNIDQAVEAWSRHPCLTVGDSLEIRPVDEEFNARWNERQASVRAK